MLFKTVYKVKFSLGIKRPADYKLPSTSFAQPSNQIFKDSLEHSK